MQHVDKVNNTVAASAEHRAAGRRCRLLGEGGEDWYLVTGSSGVVRDDVIRKDRRAARRVGAWMDLWSDRTFRQITNFLNGNFENRISVSPFILFNCE